MSGLVRALVDHESRISHMQMDYDYDLNNHYLIFLVVFFSSDEIELRIENGVKNIEQINENYEKKEPRTVYTLDNGNRSMLIELLLLLACLCSKDIT